MSQTNRPTSDDDPASLLDPTDMFTLPDTSQESSDPPAQATEPGLESLRAAIASMSTERFRTLFGSIGSPRPTRTTAPTNAPRSSSSTTAGVLSYSPSPPPIITSDETFVPKKEKSEETDLINNTYTQIMGDFLPVERSSDELECLTMQIISREDRENLNASDKGKVYFSFIKGIPNKFIAANTIMGLDDISTIHNISAFAEQRMELQKHITSIGAHSVFLILKFAPDNTLLHPDTPNGKPTNLLAASILPTLLEIERSTYYNLKRGSTFSQENLMWSYEAIRNSCDRDLQNILDAKMLRYPNHERFGPIYFYELVNQMTSVDSKAIRAITQELTMLKVTDSDGQSISRTVKLIRSTLAWLEMASMTPPDAFIIVYNILETCTVPDFLLFLKTLTTNAMLNKHTLNVEDLLLQSEDYYRTLILTKRWDASRHQVSSFQVQRNTRRATNSWFRTSPGTGEPHQRTVNDKHYKWCGTCKKWFFGDRAHLTEEHVRGFSRNNQQPTSTPSSNVATTINQEHLLTSNEPRPNVIESSLRRSYFTEGL